MSEEEKEAARESESGENLKAGAGVEETKAQARPNGEDGSKPVGADAAAKSKQSESPSLAWVGYLGGAAIVAGSVWFVATSDKPMTTGAEAEAAASENSDPAAKASGPCAQWQEKLCEGAGGPRSAACGQVKSAVSLLSADACQRELASLPETLKRITAQRADCTTLMDKLCTDLGSETDTCKMVRAKTPSFPPERCTEMLTTKYDQVLAELTKMRDRGAGASPHGPGPSGHPGAPRITRPRAQKIPPVGAAAAKPTPAVATPNTPAKTTPVSTPVK
jgi:hypothetical protein